MSSTQLSVRLTNETNIDNLCDTMCAGYGVHCVPFAGRKKGVPNGRFGVAIRWKRWVTWADSSK